MVDSICWTIKKNYLTKNDIMNLDLIATNKWKRPIYYSAPNSVKDYFNIDNYCIVEGWVYTSYACKGRSGGLYFRVWVANLMP
jgi:hypothetical protein